MNIYGRNLTVSMTVQQADMLELMALKYGYVWGRFGNISSMLRAIADGDLIVQVVHPVSDELIFPDCDGGLG